MMAFRFANGHVRAGLEPQLHRQRADHRRRGHRHRHAGRATTTAPARCATWCRTTCCSCCATLAMEPPVHFTADEVRDEKVKVLHAIRAADRGRGRRRWRCARSTRRARSAARTVAGLPRRGGRAADDSNTETYAALRLEVDNWRWAGVPFYLRTGKRLARKVTEIAVTLKPVPHLAFQPGGLGRRAAQPADPHRAAQRGRVAVARGEDPRHADADPPREHGVPLRDGVPVAVARGLRAADHRRDARRRDAVHPQRRGRGAVARSATRSSQHVGERRPGRCRSTRPARQGPEEADRCLLRRATSGGRSDRRRRRPTRSGAAQDTTPAAIEAALRELLAERHARERRATSPARVLNLVVRRRPRVERRDRQPPARRRPLPRLAHDRLRRRARRARRSTRRRRSRPTREPEPGEFALLRETVVVDVRPDAPRAPRHDRRPARRDRPGDGGVVAARPPGGASTRCCGSRRSCCWTPSTSPTSATALRRALRARRARPTSSTSRGCARRRGASASPPTFDPPRRRAELRTISVGTIRHHPESARRRRCCSSAGWRSRLGWEPGRADDAHGDGLRGRAPRAARTCSCTLEPDAEQAVPRPGRARRSRPRGARRCRSTAAPAACARTAARRASGNEREWTILGASRGEAGILGEGIRQALLRDPTYRPALAAASASWLTDEADRRRGPARRQPVPADRRLRVPVGLRDHARSSRRAATSSGCACRGWTAPSVFGAMLDRDAGGFRLGPADTMVPPARRYLPGHDGARDDLGHAHAAG